MFRRIHVVLNGAKSYKKKLLIIGAGDAAELLLREIEHSPQYPYQVVGLVDDNPQKKGVRIRGVKVLGTRKDLPCLMSREDPDEILIAIPSASGENLKGIIEDVRRYGKPVKIMPGLWQILSGNGLLDQIKVVEPEDLLFRPPVFTKTEELKSFYTQKRIMVTGAGGSIGSELSRQLAQFGPEVLILFEKHEESLFKIDLEIRNRFKNAKIISAIGDITNETRVGEIIKKNQPQIIFHAAAYKHVHLMEENPYEAFKNNVLGTKTVAKLASQNGVEKFIFISTDKAVNPINVMGMTKRIGELMMMEFSQKNYETKYSVVRFGNVLDSSGSVVPIFRDQIRKGGPITVTHPEVARYFMTIPEAVHLVLHAAMMSEGGEIFVLDMGQPVKILDLAKRMIELYGYVPGKDIEIVFTGLRPGEKLCEELFNNDERIENTSNPKILRAIPDTKDICILEKLDTFDTTGITRENIEEFLRKM
jgi:FlaA1/EpsC-like NDP-sugar epimerase